MSGGLRGDAPRPSWLLRLALRVLPAAERRVVLSELSESWSERAARDGVASARRWYRRQSLQFVLRLAADRVRPGGSAGGGGRARGPWGDGLFWGLGRELRFALRGLSRSRLLAVTVVLTVGLGVGASAAMVAVVDAVLVRPLPYPSPDRLVRIYHALQGNRWPLSVVDYDAIRAQQRSFTSVAAYRAGELTLTRGADAERVRAKRVTPGYFGVVGVLPSAGRMFEAAEGEPGGPRSVVLGWRYWQRAFGGDPGALGERVRLDGIDYTVVGILPASPGPLDEDFDVFPALQLEPPTRKGPFFLTLVGRLGPDATAVSAGEDLHAISARVFPLWRSSFQDESATYGVMPLREFVAGDVARPLLVLLAAVAFVLLIAVANAANLLVARAAERRHELAVRAALGASRGRIGRLLAAESVVLTLASGVLAAGLAGAAIRAVGAAGPRIVPRAAEITLTAPAVAVMAAALIVCALMFALLPLLLSSAATGALRLSSRGTTGGVGTERVRRALIVAEFAVAMPLLAGAGLLFNSFARLQRVDPGFEADGLLAASLALPSPGYGDDASRVAFWKALVERVEALPGVRAAGLADSRPPREAWNSNNFDLLDRPTPPGASQPNAVWITASPGYFGALGIPLVSGRAFDERDRADAPWVVLVDEAWARHNYPGEDAIGRQFHEGGCTGPDCATLTVIGVVGDVRYQGLDDAGAGSVHGTIYVPAAMAPPVNATLFLHGSGDPSRLIGPVRDAVRGLDAGLVLFNVATGPQLIDAALRTPRNLLAVVGAFAAIALLLAVIGLYGVLAYFVEQRRKEIGIRVALGGSTPAVVRLVLARGMGPVLAGGSIGLAAAIAVTGFLRDILFGVGARDAATFAAVTAAMLCTAFLACLIPAVRAALLDPVRTLRDE